MVKIKSWFVTFVAGALMLTACATIPLSTATPEQSTTATAVDTPVATTQPATEAATAVPPSITPSPANTPSPVPTATPTPAPTQEPVYPNAVTAARLKLAQQLGITQEDIQVISYERVEWPDSCLGVNVRGVMCAMIVTSGYRVRLEAQDNQYEFHTTADGSTVVQASAVETDGQKPVLVWRPTAGECLTGMVSVQQVSTAPCSGAPVTASLTETETQALKHFMTSYASFSATTPIGDITFVGSGSQVAAPSEQRAIAEFARLTSLRIAPQASQNGDIAFAWHRQGGIAGFCDDVTVSVFGQLQVSSCRTKPSQELGIQWLDAAQLRQIYDWIDQYKPYRITHDGPVSPDELVVTMEFYGRGDSEAPDSAKLEMTTFAQRIRTTFNPS